MTSSYQSRVTSAYRLRSVVTTRHVILLYTYVTAALAFMEVPKFKQLKLLYPGWKHHGGDYNDRDIQAMIGADDTYDFTHAHNTASLRMSYALNRYGGRHSLGDEPVYLSQVSRDSFTGSDGHEYIYRNTAFGPYLALKYGNPIVIRINARGEAAETMRAFSSKQGIMRFVSYHGDHAGGHIALWDCNHFHQSRDWTTEHNIIAVEFWETPDSYCPAHKPSAEHKINEHLLQTPASLRDTARHRLDNRHQTQTPASLQASHRLDNRHQTQTPASLQDTASHRLDNRHQILRDTVRHRFDNEAQHRQWLKQVRHARRHLQHRQTSNERTQASLQDG